MVFSTDQVICPPIPSISKASDNKPFNSDDMKLPAKTKSLSWSLCSLVLFWLVTPLFGASFVVTNAFDSGPGSLREAIATARTDPNPSTITFATNLSGATIQLTSTELEVTNQSLTISAAGLPGGIALDGNGGRRIFSISSNATLNLDHLVITNGWGNWFGGGVFNAGSLTMSNCLVLGNNAPGYGGGLANDGTAVLTSCTFAKNVAGYGGGGIDNGGFPNQVALSAINCTFASNSTSGAGGALRNYFGFATLAHCTVSQNSAEGAASSGFGGGGIFHGGPVPVILSHSIVASNMSVAGPDVYVLRGIFTSQGHNLIGRNFDDYFYVSGFTNGVQGDIVGSATNGINPLLGPLQMNGGFTPTMLPLAGSPVIDAGDSLFDAAGLADQRGYPRVQNGRTDIGAVELVPRVLRLRSVAGQGLLMIDWPVPSSARLQSASSLSGPWADAVEAFNGMTFTPSNSPAFYRLVE